MTGAATQALHDHAATGSTLMCHAWRIVRVDGTGFGFTDHDLPLTFEGLTFRPDTGLSARALAQSTGLGVDNTEAMGALRDDAIREDEIEQGRFDGAEVTAWQVNWSDVSQRKVAFRGTIGELRRTGGAFQAELRGLTEPLNRPVGRIFQKPCTAVLGDAACQFDTATPGYFSDLTVEAQEEGRVFRWEVLGGFDANWFTRGRLEVLDGPAAGLWGMIKQDITEGAGRIIELWEPIRGVLETGTQVRLIAGCDKRLETCRLKFLNIANFQGFPDLPGEDWVMAVPKSTGTNTGGSLR